jgi:hypothetical protein
VVTNPAGLSTTGVIAILGEADGGPHWSEEAKLSDNNFGPGDISRVIAKYGSGHLVDAFRGAVSPSSSARIQGTFNRVILIKTNLSTAASRSLLDGYGTFSAKVAGASGNSIMEKISTSQAEVAPTTGPFSFVPSASAASQLDIRVNGGALQSLVLSTNIAPSSVASAIDQLDGLLAIGGDNKLITTGLSALNSAQLDIVSGQDVSITLTAPAVWGGSAMAAGDTLRIPTGSVLAGTGSANVGWYVVTSVVNTTALASVSAKKITTGAPVTVGSVAFSATPANDIVAYRSMEVKNMTGSDRDVLADLVGINASASVAGAYLTFTLATSNLFTNAAKVGDIMYIPAGSSFIGAGSANIGWYQVVQVQNLASSAYIKAQRLSNGSPVLVSSSPIVAGDIEVLSTQAPGFGKSMEMFDGAGVGNVSENFLQLATSTSVTWLGALQTSGAELSKKVQVLRSTPQANESYIIGGSIPFRIGYAGTSASLTIQVTGGTTRLQTSVVGGAGANLDIDLAAMASISDLVAMINMQPGYSAEVTSSVEGAKSPLTLDNVAAVGICSASHKPGRIKNDAYSFAAGRNSPNNSTNIEFDLIAVAGLPEDDSGFLAGGAKGATTSSAALAAVDALAGLRCNIVVPLFSRDATEDLADGLTETASTYQVDSINAAIKDHCISMSTEKAKRHRICVLSKKADFADAKAAAQNLNHFRVNFVFQDMLDLSASTGDVEQFQPWMAAIKAAGMQAAGFYKAIYNKAVNCSGVVNNPGFDDQTDSLCEDAILAGMMPLQVQADGSIPFLTDQTTYGFDNNFVYNSMQAVYVSDIMALSVAESVKQAFIGESVADVTVSTVTSFLRGKVNEFRAKKLVVGTDELPEGWRYINVSIIEDVLQIDMQVVEATSIRFAPITLSIEGIKASATA